MKYITKRNLWQQDIKTSHYVKALLVAISILYVLAYLFYYSNVVFIISIPLLIPYIKYWEKQQEITIKRKFVNQFKEYLTSLATAMGAGYAVENAMVEARLDVSKQFDCESRLMNDLEKMERLLKMNVPVVSIWQQWAKMVDIEELHQFVTVFVVAKKSGGDSVAIIRKAIGNICERLEVEEEIQVGLTAKRLEFQVMSCIPIGILLYMKASFPEFMEVLYGGLLGWSIMTICLGVYVVAYLWGSNIVKIEV